MIFTRTDLLVDISERELVAIAEKIVVPGDPDPITSTITEQQARMERYIHRYVVDDDWQKDLLRALVFWKLYKRLGSIPKKREAGYEEAMKELREIRDGKFPDVPLKETPPEDIVSARGRSGSDKRYQDR
jgi:Bacteriophage Mu, Gp36